MSKDDDRKLYIPNPNALKYEPDDADLVYAQALEDLDQALSECKNSDAVAVLLSTCRNEYLALNALFAELSIAIGGGDGPPSIIKAADFISNGNYVQGLRELNETQKTLTQFLKKEEIWARREELHRQFEESVSNMKKIRRDRIHRVLSDNKSTDRRTDQSWDERLYEINPASHSNLAERFDVLRTVEQSLYRAVSASRKFSTYANQITQQSDQIELDLMEADKPKVSWGSVVEKIELMSEAARLNVKKNEGYIIISKSAVDAELISFSTTQDPDSGGLHNIRLFVTSTLRLIVGQAYEQLRTSFKPNVALAPMPHPYLIDLTPYVPKVTQQDKPILHPWVLGAPTAPSKIAKVAIAHYSIPLEYYNTEYRYDEKAPVERLGQVALDLVKFAAQNEADVILFPEYALPRSCRGQLEQLARDEDIILIAGIEASWQEKGLVNEAVVLIPGVDNCFVQKKQKPSGYEEAPAHFKSDGLVNIFANTRIGNFGVIICSDILELDIQQTLMNPKHHPDFIFVPAYNPYPKLFETLAVADAARMYSNIVISNTCSTKDGCDSSGSCVATPKHDGLNRANDILSLPTNQDGENYGISIIPVSIDAIGSRHKPKPQKGYLPPSYSARA